MKRLSSMAYVPLCLFLIGCSVPAPNYYDHAMLRYYFGSSPEGIRTVFGQPSSVGRADSCVAPPQATEEERKRFNQTTEGMQYVYSAEDGDLVFHFNLNNSVFAITYLGDKVAPPQTPIPKDEKSP